MTGKSPLGKTLAGTALMLCALGAVAHAQTPGSGPVNQTPPTVSRSGDTLSTDNGSWVGAQSFSYAWLRCTATNTGSCGEPIAGATDPAYRLVSADAATYLRARVTASSSSGSSSSMSEPFGPIESAPAPRLRPFPVIVLTGSERGRITSITSFTVRGPRGALVSARCRGKGCEFRSLRRRIGSTKRLRLRRVAGNYRAGDVIEVRVTARGRVGKFTRIRIRRDRVPARTDQCLQPGAKRPSRCPA